MIRQLITGAALLLSLSASAKEIALRDMNPAKPFTASCQNKRTETDDKKEVTKVSWQADKKALRISGAGVSKGHLEMENALFLSRIMSKDFTDKDGASGVIEASIFFAEEDLAVTHLYYKNLPEKNTGFLKKTELFYDDERFLTGMTYEYYYNCDFVFL